MLQVLFFKKSCRDPSLGLCVISEILLLQSPHICLGLVLFGFFPLLSALCMGRFLGSEVCASIFSFLTTHRVTDVSVKQLFVLQTTPSHRGCSGWPSPGTAPAELQSWLPHRDTALGGSCISKASMGTWKQNPGVGESEGKEGT